jgi:hypothetical protein
MKNPISRIELLELSKKKETEEDKKRNRINHIVDQIYDMVLSIAKYNYTTTYMYTVGFISQEDLLNVIKELRRLFPKCVITNHQSPDHVSATASETMVRSSVNDETYLKCEAGGGSFSEKTTIRIDWT